LVGLCTKTRKHKRCNKQRNRTARVAKEAIINILTNYNKSYNLDRIPDEVEDIRYCAYDCTNPDNMDYFFYPLIFLESFYAPAIVLEIGEHRIQMPLDWSIVVCDENYTDMEIVPLTSLNDRGFHTLLFNPLNHMVPSPVEVNIVNVYADVKWFFPKLKSGVLLSVPVEDKEKPLCAMFVKEANKIPNHLQLANLLE